MPLSVDWLFGQGEAGMEVQVASPHYRPYQCMSMTSVAGSFESDHSGG